VLNFALQDPAWILIGKTKAWPIAEELIVIDEQIPCYVGIENRDKLISLTGDRLALEDNFAACAQETISISLDSDLLQCSPPATRWPSTNGRRVSELRAERRL
jgi:hypothetical protein